MKRDLLVENLFDALEDLEVSLHWLKRSHRLCRSISDVKHCSEDEFDDIEALMGRFSRSSDILIQKVLRAVDAVEFELPGTLLDAANRAEKRGIIDAVVTLRIIRETRNRIAHEYAAQNFQELFSAVLEQTPELLSICDKAISYCLRFKPGTPDKGE